MVVEATTIATTISIIEGVLFMINTMAMIAAMMAGVEATIEVAHTILERGEATEMTEAIEATEMTEVIETSEAREVERDAMMMRDGVATGCARLEGMHPQEEVARGTFETERKRKIRGRDEEQKGIAIFNHKKNWR
jgi:hypothetical protein